MFDLFHIIYFTPFYFPDGTSAKPKYFIPIHQDGENLIFAYLPTSQDYIPDSLLNHGCINIPAKQISCYCFKKDRPVTNCEFSFEKNTFIYAYQMGEFNQKLMNEIYSKKDVDYTVIGELCQNEKKAFIKCLLESSFVKRKIKRILSTHME